MTTRVNYRPGEAIEWVRVGPAGDSQRRGEVWAPAPMLPGVGRCLWCQDSDGATVLVAVTSIRHRAGRHGRFIDKGERYEVTIGVPWRVPGPRASIPALAGPSAADLVDMEAFYAICEQAAAGE